MSAEQGTRRALRTWLADVSSNVVAGIVLASLAVVGTWVYARYPAVRDWLDGSVSMRRWGVIAGISAGALVGFVGGRFWPRQSSGRESGAATMEPAATELLPEFEPDGLGQKIIRMLRYGDGRWASEDTIAHWLEVTSRQDLRETLKDLQGRGWLEGHGDNYILDDASKRYRLASSGIAYARREGYKTQGQMDREKAAEAVRKGAAEDRQGD